MIKQKTIKIKDIKEFTNFIALESYINSLFKEQREEAEDKTEKLEKEIKRLNKIMRIDFTDKKSIGRFCWLCGNSENITIHHLKCPKKKAPKRKELGIMLFRGEVIPLCRTCHNKIEELKQQMKNE